MRFLFAFGVLVTVAVQVEWSVPRTVAQRNPYPFAFASASVSGDGRFVAFESVEQLLPTDTNPVSDIYLLNIESGNLELVSVGADGTAMNHSSSMPRLSADARYVAFESVTPRPQPPCSTVFLRDRQGPAARALAVARDDPSRPVCAQRPAISSDGQWVAFESAAQDLVDGVDANGAQHDVYVVNTGTGRVARVSVETDGTQSATGGSYGASLSATGRLVAFTSTGCLDGDSARSTDSASGACKPRVYVRDLIAGLTRSVKAAGDVWPNGSAYGAALSGDGRYVAFVSTATNLAKGDTNERPDIYIFDLNSGSTELLSRRPDGKAGNGPSSRPAISESARFVAFDSTASDLICTRRCAARDHDHNLVSDVFLLDRERGRMRRLSQEVTGEPWWAPSIGPALDGPARLIAFSSRHAMDAGDVRADFDLFVLHIRK